MQRRSGRFVTMGLAVVGWLLLFPQNSLALDPQVRDDAGFFSRQTIDQANEIIRQIKRDHGKDVMVETFAAIPGNMQSQYDPANKDQFFEIWLTSRAKELGVNGVYVLICKDPSRAQIGVGKETRLEAFTPSNRDEMRDILLKGFRAKEYDDGLISALNYAKATLGRNMRAPSPAPSPSALPGSSSPPNLPAAQPPVVQAPPVPVRRSFNFCGLMPCVVLVIIGIGLLIVFRIVRRMMGGGRPMGGMPPSGGGGPFGGYGGGGGYPSGRGGGFGGGLLGGILGSVLGGYAQDRWSRGSGGQVPSAPPPLPPTSGGGIFDEPPTSSFPSDQGQDFSSSGGDFGGGGGDVGGGGGGGGDSGGGGGASSGGDF